MTRLTKGEFARQTQKIREVNERVQWALDNLDLDAASRETLAKQIAAAVFPGVAS